MIRLRFFFELFLLAVIVAACSRTASNRRMAEVLNQIHQQNQVADNFFAPDAKVRYYDSLALTATSEQQRIRNSYFRAYFLLQTGEVEQAIEIYKELLRRMNPQEKEAYRMVNLYLGVAYLRLGEQVNCVSNKTAESCIFPIAGAGIHAEASGSQLAVRHLEAAVEPDLNDLEGRWLLNIAYMTLGGYPERVPVKFLLPGLDAASERQVNPFQEVSGSLGLTIRDMSGGVIVEDFNQDGTLDVVTSAWGLDEPMKFWLNKGDGTFENASENSKLGILTGGLNLMQTDYNNDGLLDIFVLRGGWMARYGRQPNSLLRNNGDGTFTDVTFEARLTSFFPTQTATWNDFNNDGWLDVFIGNETTQDVYPCELYINQKDGTFLNLAAESGASIMDYVKGVTSGDFDNDGWQDIFISTMNRKCYLLRNGGMRNGHLQFEDVTAAAGLDEVTSKTFPTWFWDFDNDGLLDIFLCGYEFEKSLGYYEAAEKLEQPLRDESKMKLFRNNGDGTFSNVAVEVGLNRVVNAMGSNFGDFDYDGNLDFYLGTGNPDTKSIIPNRLFKNEGGKFYDVTAAGRVGHLQKGHGVAFADLDYDGDLDIFAQVGGSFKGESFQNSFYLNPGQGGNNWIGIRLEGVKANKPGIGSRITLTVTDEGKARTINRDMNSGGSFGASPLMAQIGIGRSKKIDRLEITWAGSNHRQIFTNVVPNQFISIEEGNPEITTLSYKRMSFVREPSFNP